MRDNPILRSAFGKAAGFLYAVVVSVVANLLFAYVLLPHATMTERAAATPREAAVAALLPPVAAPLPTPPAERVTAASSGVLPGPGSGGLY